MGEQMKNAPVYFVIGQVRFNPSPVPIREHITEIQEGFRKLGFSDYRQQKLQQINLVLHEDKPTHNPGEVIDLYEFANPERTALFNLDRSQISFQTVAYKSFEDFLAVFMRAFDLLTQNVELDFIERVGLRFLDAVMPRKEEDLMTYLHPQLLGLSALANELEPDFSLSEALMHRGNDTILARVTILKGKVDFPQDLANVPMEIGERFRGHGGLFAILDNDAFHDQRQIIRPQDSATQTIAATFRRLRSLIGMVFDKSVTPEAMRVWKGEA